MEKILLYTAGKLIFLMRHEIAVLYCQLLTNIVWIWLENIAVVICIFNPEKWSLTVKTNGGQSFLNMFSRQLKKYKRLCDTFEKWHFLDIQNLGKRANEICSILPKPCTFQTGPHFFRVQITFEIERVELHPAWYCK